MYPISDDIFFLGLAINMVNGSHSIKIFEAIQKHFRKPVSIHSLFKQTTKTHLSISGRPIDKLDADDLDEVERIAENK